MKMISKLLSDESRSVVIDYGLIATFVSIAILLRLVR